MKLKKVTSDTPEECLAEALEQLRRLIRQIQLVCDGHAAWRDCANLHDLFEPCVYHHVRCC